MKKDLIKEGILILFVLLCLTFLFYGIPTRAVSQRYSNEELKTAMEDSIIIVLQPLSQGINLS